MKLKTFSHGIHPFEGKDRTADKPIKRFPFAPYLVVLLSQHIGKPSVPVVIEGQEVVRGELIARADGFVSTPLHAPASGVVKSLGRALDFNGVMAPAIIIEPYAGSLQTVPHTDPRDISQLSPEEIVSAIQQIGMVGLGGAAFPTHVKFSPPEGKVVETLIVNGCECEPYLTADHRVMLEQSAEVIKGTKLVIKALAAQDAVIAIENNKPDAIAALKHAAAGQNNISVQACETKYPQGAEKMLTTAILGKEIPSGGFPADIGVMVSNVTTLAEIGTLLPAGQGLIERVVTISGSGLKEPGNYLMPIGTPLNFILETVGLKTEAREIVWGGPMMGKAVSFMETPITKGISGILVLTDEEVVKKREQDTIYPCIKCASCVDACPIYLNPSRLGILARKHEFDAMAENHHLYDCFECGCCSYVCPSNIPLVQHFRVAKDVLRKRRAA